MSDACDKLGLRDRVASGLEQRSTTRRIAGRAVTYRLVPADRAPLQPTRRGTWAPPRSSSRERRRDRRRAAHRHRCRQLGRQHLTLGAKVRGIAGVIADGPVRDIDEARAYDFPIYCRAQTARTARGRVVEADTNQPVTIGEVKVSAGDFVIADASGVAFIPVADIERVLDAAEAIAGREAAMAKALLAGTPIPQVMGGDYEFMLR